VKAPLVDASSFFRFRLSTDLGEVEEEEKQFEFALLSLFSLYPSLDHGATPPSQQRR